MEESGDGRYMLYSRLYCCLCNIFRLLDGFGSGGKRREMGMSLEM